MFPSSGRDRFVSAQDLAADCLVGKFGKIRMRPTVIANLVAFACCPGHDLRMFGYVFADDKEGCFNVVSGQQIEKPGSKCRARAVIKGHRDAGCINVNCAERDGRLFECSSTAAPADVCLSPGRSLCLDVQAADYNGEANWQKTREGHGDGTRVI